MGSSDIETMQHALELARKSPPKPTNFRVGAVLMRLADGHISTEGYTLELPGNTHAEECCLLKLAGKHSIAEEDLWQKVTEPHAVYTTVEPCSKRLSVYVGVQEPDTFVSQNEGRRMLEEAGIEVIHVKGLEESILQVATAGHISE
ncbi:unnamed protein product [Clonostachys rhizophaga]|uniref:CMP/dCMP-type deaminase domain-containing protein n=1 Tax=Clonostachys rhizophaga TaxID=160324 RepID=A0A9N9YGA1_9HYPO|nr:unnamed protein product [Clonostachys rhizophaga]